MDLTASQAPLWTSEMLFYEGDTYFHEYLAAIDQAKGAVALEAYIFSTDGLGERVASALARAAERGCEVRVIVDAIGSPDWEGTLGSTLKKAGVFYCIFHKPPWQRFTNSHHPGPPLTSLHKVMRRLNTRNHRKLLIVDECIAFLGGMNVWGVHLASQSGARVWRDTGVRLEGRGVLQLQASFNGMWYRERRPLRRFLRSLAGRRLIEYSSDILDNASRASRERNYRMLLDRIHKAVDRLWITSAYFVPPGSLLAALRSASERGVDVRVIVPRVSDIFFMPWVSSALYCSLLTSGASVFEYRPSVLHAKSILGDSWAIVGSSNMNHRSIIHDMEIDVVLRSPASLQSLGKQFVLDQGASRRVTIDDYRARPWWERALGRVFLAIRSIL